MRRIISVAIIAVLVMGVLVPFASVPAQAEDLTPAQTERVKANCVSIKSSLSQLHASDALLRVNRGQNYEAMATKLMDTFNSRLASNSLDNKAMVTVTNNYRSALDAFRRDYIAYEQKLAAAIRIDCVSQPNTFHAAIEEARTLRAKVYEDVKKLHRLIDDYRSSVGDFLLNFKRVAN